jgi:hypothetical protein
LLVVMLLLAACADEDGSGSPGTTDDPGTTTGVTQEPSDGGTTTTLTTAGTAPAGDCETSRGEPFIETDSVQLTDLGEIDGVGVKAAMYPHPDYDGELWSQWGQGIVLDDGRFYSAIGDHLAVDGNSFVYEYDPTTDTLTTVGDVLSYVDHVPGTWGYGKIHSQMVPGPCGEIYFSTYWGSFRDITFEGNYTGDVLFRLDPFGRTLQPLGVPVEFYGQASLAAHTPGGLIYGEAVDPVPMSDEVEIGPFFVYDVIDEQVVYTGPDEPHAGFRSILVDAEGTAYYSIGGGELQTYDPATGESATHEATIPGEVLRAATEPGPDGSVYGVTDEPDTFFAMRPDGSIEELGDALEYTASMALAPDGSAFYYMPGAHGDAPEWGSPLISVDTATGEQTVIVELNEAIQEEFGHTVGGTYNVVVSPDGDTIYLGVNGGEVGSEDEAFGEVFLIVLDLP